MAIEIVDLPMKMVIFHSYVSLPEGMWNHTIFFSIDMWNQYLYVSGWWFGTCFPYIGKYWE